jgi:hypothetical protein
VLPNPWFTVACSFIVFNAKHQMHIFLFETGRIRMMHQSLMMDKVKSLHVLAEEIDVSLLIQLGLFSLRYFPKKENQ